MQPALLAALLAQIGSSGTSSGDTPARVVGAALLERGAYQFAVGLSDGVGARLAGSPEAERAVAWAMDAMKRAGLQRVRKEPVQVRRWVRGPASAVLRADGSPGAGDQPLAVLALGGSVATPADGLEAEVVEAISLEEIAALGEKARGRIVLINREMQPEGDSPGYGPVSGLRWRGPSAAARVGALALLIRSAGSGRHRQAHTGGTHYADGVPAIPAAALAAEDAELIHRRLAARGSARVRLALEARELGKAPSFNVLGELPGGASKDEIVLIGAHLDSWDVGRGALDDAAGCGIVLDTARILSTLRPGLRRTLRVVLFMSEELDGAGSAAYAAAHAPELGRHVAAMEADFGDGRPRRYSVSGGPDAVALVKRWVTPLAALAPPDVRASDSGGADVEPLRKRGVPLLDIAQDPAAYFDWHHTAGDTVDKLDPLNLGLATAAFAHLTWALATAPERLPRPAPLPKGD
jgi:hypothetical protein